mmetsp:Transcript_57509/g.115451  ORF Transcript_57509/g.115451 Transcript_57509/m.115451 type:complete len:208 (-) Transcript_57509:182-805(-)
MYRRQKMEGRKKERYHERMYTYLSIFFQNTLVNRFLCLVICADVSFNAQSVRPSSFNLNTAVKNIVNKSVVYPQDSISASNLYCQPTSAWSPLRQQSLDGNILYLFLDRVNITPHFFCRPPQHFFQKKQIMRSHIFGNDDHEQNQRFKCHWMRISRTLVWHSTQVQSPIGLEHFFCCLDLRRGIIAIPPIVVCFLMPGTIEGSHSLK